MLPLPWKKTPECQHLSGFFFCLLRSLIKKKKNFFIFTRELFQKKKKKLNHEKGKMLPRFKIGIGSVSETPACLQQQESGLVPFLNLLDSECSVDDRTDAAAELATAQDRVNPFSVRQNLHNASAYFIRTLSEIQTRLLQDYCAAWERGLLENEELEDFSAGEFGDPTMLPELTLRELHVYQIFLLSQLYDSIWFQGISSLEGFDFSRWHETGQQIEQRRDKGERAKPVLNPQELKGLGLGQLLAEASNRCSADYDLNRVYKTVSKLFPVPPSSFEKAAFSNFVWSVLHEEDSDVDFSAFLSKYTFVEVLDFVL